MYEVPCHAIDLITADLRVGLGEASWRLLGSPGRREIPLNSTRRSRWATSRERGRATLDFHGTPHPVKYERYALREMEPHLGGRQSQYRRTYSHKDRSTTAACLGSAQR